MGTCYYFARPDNKTLFAMDKAYGLRELLHVDARTPVPMGDLETALILWFEEWPLSDQPPGKARALAERVEFFAGGKPIYLITEHDAWIDEWVYDSDDPYIDHHTVDGRYWP